MTKLSLFLSCGAVNALPAADITARTGLDARSIRHAVEAERRSGAVILADERGYFLPSEDRETAVYEVTEWISKTAAVVRSHEIGIRNAQSYLESLGVQRE